MADIISFQSHASALKPIPVMADQPVSYSVDVTLYPDNLMFTVNDIKPDSSSLLRIADELERIARIIRTDVVVGLV
ncbi:MAG: hypothetical protein KGJ06_01495 [Pseudomonadota bacterium]|nr:hypothetical protein [Pseudomonadota bacterium]